MNGTGRNIAVATLVFAVLLAACSAGAGDVRAHRLSSGVTVLTMPGDWNRIVAVSVMVDAGSKHDPAKLPGLAYLTNTMLMQGTTTRTAPELAELVDSNGIQMGTETTEDYAHIYLTAMDTQLDMALEIATDVLQRPAFDESRLLDAQRSALDALEKNEQDPSNTPFLKVGELLYGKHPYVHPAQGTRKGIDRVGVDHLIKFHTSRYVGGSTVIAIVGSFDPKEAVKKLEELLGDYPNKRAPEAEFPRLEKKEHDSVRIFKDVDEAFVAMGFLAPRAGDADFSAMRVVDALIGLGSGARLPLALGETGAGISESNGSFCRSREEGSVLVVYASTDDAELALDTMESEILRLRTEPVTDEELASAKNRLVGTHVIRGQTNLVRAARLASYELAGLGFDYADTFLSAVKRVDKDDVTRVASEWLTDPATVLVVPGKTAPSRASTKRAGI